MNDEWIDEIGILAKLELTGKERERAKKDVEEMLGYIDRLKWIPGAWSRYAVYFPCIMYFGKMKRFW